MASFSDAVNFNFKVLTSAGLWSLKSDNEFKKLLYYFYQCLSILLYSSGVILMCIDLYIIKHDLEKLNINLCTVVTVTLHLTKSLNFLRKFPVINKLKASLIQRAEEETDEECKNIVEKTTSEMKFLNKVFYATSCYITGSWCAIAFWESKSGARKLPFRIWTPFDLKATPYYEIFSAYEVLVACIVVADFTAQDLACIHFLIGISAEYEILGKKIGKVNELYGNVMEDASGMREEASRILKKVVKYHQEIIEEIKLFEEVNNKTMLLHFVALTFLLAILGLDLVMSKEVNTRFITQTAYLCGVLMFLYVFCHFGGRLEYKSYDLGFEIYNMPWYSMETKFRQDLSIILARAQQAPTATGAKLFPVNFITYLTVLKSFYEMLASFRQLFQI